MNDLQSPNEEKPEFSDNYSEGMNLYNNRETTVDVIRYRLDGTERISEVIDTLRGGVKSIDNNTKKYSEEYRMMNELGVQRVRMALETGVNKINHLTKYQDEDRIFRQIKSVMKDFVKELTLNMKVWSPESTFLDGRLKNDGFHKVRNKRLIVQQVENALLQSMLRGNEGFEADITGKNFNVSEVRHQEPVQEQKSSFWNPFGGKR